MPMPLVWPLSLLPLNSHRVPRDAYFSLPLNSQLPVILQTKIHPKAAQQQRTVNFI